MNIDPKESLLSFVLFGSGLSLDQCDVFPAYTFLVSFTGSGHIMALISIFTGEPKQQKNNKSPRSLSIICGYSAY